MPRENTIVLPDSETIMTRLTEVDDNCHYVQKFYPLLAKHAGCERDPVGIAMLLQIAIDGYTEGLLPVIARQVSRNAEKYIDALIIDVEFSASVKEHWVKMQDVEY